MDTVLSPWEGGWDINALVRYSLGSSQRNRAVEYFHLGKWLLFLKFYSLPLLLVSLLTTYSSNAFRKRS